MRYSFATQTPPLFINNKITAAILLSVTATGTLADSSRSSMLEEVVVTAEKREASLQDTPISITAFSANALEQMGVFEVNAVADFSPNVRISKQTSTADNIAIAIRGISSAEPALTVDPAVALYMDGVYIARSAGAAFDIVDLERIEVLRGPQGTLYGRNATGGAINLISQKPKGEFGFKQLLSSGNDGYFRSQTTVDTPTWNNASAKLSYVHNQKDGRTDNAYGLGEHGQQEADAFRIALLWDAAENLTLEYVYDQNERTGNGMTDQITFVRDGQAAVGGAIIKQAQETSSATRADQVYKYNADDDVSFSDIKGNALTVTWDVGEVTYKSITSYREWDSASAGTDFGSFPSDGLTVLDGKGGTVPEGELVSVFRALRESSQQQFTQEFQAVGNAFDDQLRFVVGAYYFEEQGKEDNPQTLAIPAIYAYGDLNQLTQSFLCADPTFANPFACIGKDTVVGPSTFVYTIDNNALALYGQFSYSLTDRMDITLGLRYTEDEKTTTLLTSDLDSKASDNWSNFSPSLTLDYVLNDDVNLYAKITNGYRAGGFNARATTLSSFTQPVDEETVRNFEVGMKSDWWDKRLRVNVSAFRMEYKDQQVQQFEATNSGASTINVNAGESINQGVELEVTVLPIEGLMVSMNYGLLDIDWKEYETVVVDPDTGFSTGIQTDISDFASTKVHAPRKSASMIIQYEFLPWSFGQLTARVDGSWVTDREYHAQLTNYTTSKEHGLVNGRLTLNDIPVKAGNLKVALWGKNLDNTEYKEWGIDFGSLGYAVNTYGEMRSYGIDITYEY